MSKVLKYIDNEVVVPIHLAIWNAELGEKGPQVRQANGYYKYNPKTDKAEYIRIEDKHKKITPSTMKVLEKQNGNHFRFFLAPTMKQLHFILTKHEISLHEYQKNSDNDMFYLVNTLDNLPVDESQFSEDYLTLYGILDLDYEYYHS